MMSKLLVKPSKPDSNGRIHAITPASAGWTYVGFEVYRLKSGQSLTQETGDREACIVMLSGRAHVGAGAQDFGTIGGRSSPFEPDPWSLYAPSGRCGPRPIAKWHSARLQAKASSPRV
jgi:5-deoxy-glucuronate isomerase